MGGNQTPRIPVYFLELVVVEECEVYGRKSRCPNEDDNTYIIQLIPERRNVLTMMG
jgi:hypothetical protein